MSNQKQRATEVGVTLRQIYYRHEGHTLLKAQFDKLLSRRREEVKRGIVTEARGLALLGAPGSGKSRSIEELFKRHDDLVLPAPDQERADVISFRVPSPATLKDVGMTALEALGYPLSRDRPAGIIWGQVREFLRKRQTLILHMDEVQDVYTSNSKNVQRNVINTLKSLMQHPEWPVSIILTGMPEVRDMLNVDRQLSRRVYPIYLQPLSYLKDEAMVRDMTRDYMSKAELRPTTDLLLEDFLSRLVHAGAYEFGMVVELIIAAIEEAIATGSDCLDTRHFAISFRKRTGAYDGLNPFLTPDYQNINVRLILPDSGA